MFLVLVDFFSDHVSLCLKTYFAPPLVRDFRYELCWMLRPNFRNLVEKIWSLPVRGKKSIEIWKEKTKRLKKMLKGWNINVEGRYLKLKRDLMSRIEKLELEWNLKKNYGRRRVQKNKLRERNSLMRVMRILNSFTLLRKVGNDMLKFLF
jgi:hypothetical protein